MGPEGEVLLPRFNSHMKEKPEILLLHSAM